MPTDDPVLLTRRDGAVLTLTLNRPQALNSFDGALHDALMAALKDAAADATVRCVVLTGAGRGFCAGQDLSDPAVAPGPQPRDIGALIESRYKPLALLLADFPVPLVAAVNGVAAGAGANLALNCDLVLAARSASFIQAFAKIGLIPDCGGTWLLPRLVGRANALALALLGDKLPAEEAQRIGLIWRVVDDAALAAEAQAVAARLAAMPSHALAETRRAFAAADHLSLAEALSREADVQRKLGFAHDYQEGVTAFFAKRAPQFKDR
ncbi:MAG: 2-(1,2-epoxy-1,2-dihydrophenyl)acetyl-CoA isomerase PaaG [Piscinibacter sp.]|uniref:enoyl-CoA hydratase-related protein n=1 Tax=Piscinibacter TaxID=1114981 RepID=UPI000FDEADB2|nr:MULTISPECIES: enoyl-CoA hydratase-related protein [Piscinibacter]MCW5663436.1 2-(1,2-epoxy-1,2-dihydrophenyl)acetyl-CoA isomerase PaaG [Piscinibacter sp.]